MSKDTCFLPGRAASNRVDSNETRSLMDTPRGSHSEPMSNQLASHASERITSDELQYTHALCSHSEHLESITPPAEVRRKTTFSFLALPPELREIIHRYSHPILTKVSPSDPMRVHQDRRGYRIEDGVNEIVMTRVCTTTRRDVVSMLFRTCHWRIEIFEGFEWIASRRFMLRRLCSQAAVYGKWRVDFYPAQEKQKIWEEDVTDILGICQEFGVRADIRLIHHEEVVLGLLEDGHRAWIRYVRLDGFSFPWTELQRLKLLAMYKKYFDQLNTHEDIELGPRGRKAKRRLNFHRWNVARKNSSGAPPTPVLAVDFSNKLERQLKYTNRGMAPVVGRTEHADEIQTSAYPSLGNTTDMADYY